MRLLTALFAAVFLAQPGRAELPGGYVVKVESGSVYLDFTEKTGAVAGQPFSVYTEGEELKHPVTGQSLGRIESTVGKGKITQVMAMYSVGSVEPGAGGIKPGMKARLGAVPPAPVVPAAPVAAPAAAAEGTRAPRWKSPMFKFQIAGMAVAEFEQGKLGTALSDGKKIYLYDYPPADNKEKASFELPGSAIRVLSLDAADLNGNGRAELFVVAYNQTFNRVETTILELDGGQWKQLAQTPWIARAIQDPDGNQVIAAQQLVDDQTFPFSGIYPLAYQDGKYATTKKSLKPKRVDWIYDFTNANLDGSPSTLYLTSLSHIRVQFDNGSWKTTEAYEQTPVRLRWPNSDGRLLEFHPPMRVAKDAAGKQVLYVSRNLSMLGSISEPFGLFNGGELQRKSWDGVSLVTDWKADLGGYSPSIAVVGPAERRDVAVAIVGTSGKSAVWVYDP